MDHVFGALTQHNIQKVCSKWISVWSGNDAYRRSIGGYLDLQDRSWKFRLLL
jgi:hypothetical protein